MIMNSKKRELPTKQESDISDKRITKGSSSSRTWAGLKDPRIVRVSRTFGGKDRHSKVSTIKGLRDRRIRLSVQTAIQLYDLQDRLGLSQPSKVVDWLLNAAQQDINELPPLHMLPEDYVQYPQSMAVSHDVIPPQPNSLTQISSMGNFERNKNVVGEYQTTLPKSPSWNSYAPLKSKCDTINDKSNLIKGNDQVMEDQSAHLFTYNPLLKPGHSSHPGLLNPSFFHWESSNTSLPNLGGLGYSSQTEETHNYNTSSMPSPMSLPFGSQLMLRPSGTMPSIFPTYVSNPEDYDPKYINHFQMLGPPSQNVPPNSVTTSLYSISPAIRPFQVSIPHKNLSSKKNNER